VDELEKHREYLAETGELTERRLNNTRMEVIELIESELRKIVINHTEEEGRMKKCVEDILAKNTDVYTVRDEFLKSIRG
jgi:LAO/AO transport system kinase